MRVLITRPEVDANPLAQTLRQRGHTPVVAPCLVIVSTQTAPPADWVTRDFVFTSVNGIRAVLDQLPMAIQNRRRAFAVGPITAQAAMEAGFDPIIEAGGDVAALVKTIVGTAGEASGTIKLMHVSGRDKAGDLAAAVARHRHIDFTSWPAYRADPVDGLPSEAAEFLAGPAGSVLFYSPRSAKIFATLVARAEKAPLASGHSAHCLSAAVAEAAGVLPWRAVHTADTPVGHALLNTLISPK